MAARVVQGIINTTEGHDVEIVCTVDRCPQTVKLVSGVLRSAPDNITWTVYPSDELRGCSKAWNDALRWSKGDPVVFAADDLIFEKGWLDESLKLLAEFPDGWGMVGFNDGHWDGNELATHYLMSRRFIVEVLGGVVAWECYRHSFNDLEVNARAKAAGRFVWAPKARVTHLHWLFGGRRQDETDTRRLPEHPNDERVYKEREAAGFPVDYEPVVTA